MTNATQAAIIATVNAPMTPAMVAKATGKNVSTVRSAMHVLVKAGNFAETAVDKCWAVEPASITFRAVFNSYGGNETGKLYTALKAMAVNWSGSRTDFIQAGVASGFTHRTVARCWRKGWAEANG